MRLKNSVSATFNSNSDGTFYAEYDVVKAHPAKTGFFVESVTAWGNAGQIKAETKLLAMPE